MIASTVNVLRDIGAVRHGTPMTVAIRKLIASLETNLVDEDDKSRRRALKASLDAAKKTLKHVEHTETEETPDKEDSDEEDEACGRSDEDADEEDEESGNETKRKAKAKDDDEDDDDEDDDDEDDEDEEDEEDEAAALAAIVAKVPGKKGARLAGRLRALVDKAKAADSQAERIARIEQERKEEKRDAMINAALHSEGGPRITPSTAKKLRAKSFGFVRSYLALHTRPIVNTDEVRAEQDGRPGAALSAEIAKEINRAVACGGDRAKLEAAHKDAQAKALTGGKASF